VSFSSDRINLSLRAALDLRMQRHELLSHNLANADTPGFRPKDLEFEGLLQSAIDPAPSAQVGLGMHTRPTETQDVVERPEVGDTLDDNAVDTDKEMARVADNSLNYQAQLELLRRRYAAIQRAISTMSGV
jgi:flagellar basal-body rod protein FlgB